MRLRLQLRVGDVKRVITSEIKLVSQPDFLEVLVVVVAEAIGVGDGRLVGSATYEEGGYRGSAGEEQVMSKSHGFIRVVSCKSWDKAESASSGKSDLFSW